MQKKKKKTGRKNQIKPSQPITGCGSTQLSSQLWWEIKNKIEVQAGLGKK
jgi:hypothetical protein